MATDYDAPRENHEETDAAKHVKSINVERTSKKATVIDEDETELADSFILPGAEVSAEEISIEVLPEQADEFTCSSCFMVRHRSQLVAERDGQMFCAECEG